MQVKGLECATFDAYHQSLTLGLHHLIWTPYAFHEHLSK
jgi:hypothetical protein